MGGSRKWIKSLVGLKKSEGDICQEKTIDASKSKKWKLWRTSSGSRSGSRLSASEAASETSSVKSADPLTAAVAAIVRAPPRDFQALRQEWAAVRIQSTFRAFLAKRALKALKGIVRIQALVRGRQVRKQLAVTLKCMQALVRVQAKARAQRMGLILDEDLQQEINSDDPVKLAEEGWCDSRGSIDEIKAKIQMRHEATIKRERALAYARSSQLQWRATTPNRRSTSLRQCSSTRLQASPGSVLVTRNNVSTRVTAKPPNVILSACSSDLHSCEESSISTSSLFTATPVACNYMSLTKSAKARISASNSQRKVLSTVDSQSSNGSDQPVACKHASRLTLNGRSMSGNLDKEKCRFDERLSSLFS